MIETLLAGIVGAIMWRIGAAVVAIYRHPTYLIELTRGERARVATPRARFVEVPPVVVALAEAVARHAREHPDTPDLSIAVEVRERRAS